MPAVVLEDIRSAYNVGNIIRTADAFWFDVVISGYSPSPSKDKGVLKTSLWAEKSVKIFEFWNPKDAIEFVRQRYWVVVAAEITENAKSILKFDKFLETLWEDIAIVFWNEVNWVLSETLEIVDEIFYIPMNWVKESLNVSQSAAIFMWEVWKALNLEKAFYF